MRHAATMLTALAFLFLAAPLAAQEEEAEQEQQEQEQEQQQEQVPAVAEQVQVPRAVVATGVENREPVGVDTVFTADVGILYFYTEFEGDFGELEIEHVWLRDGEEIARFPLIVRGPRWRTWSSKEILPEWTGSWTVRAVDANGTEHATAEFTVGGGM